MALSVIALLAFLARTFLDFRYIIGVEFAPDVGGLASTILVCLVLVGGWLWWLVAAAGGSRAGLVATLAFNLVLNAGLGLGTLVSFCPSPCQTGWPLMEIANWSNLVLGVLAAVANWRSLAAQARRA